MSSREKEHFFLGYLGLSSRKIHCSSSRKFYVSSGYFSYSMGNLFGIDILYSFAQGSYFLRATNF
jgi:hypothetical protein